MRVRLLKTPCDVTACRRGKYIRILPVSERCDPIGNGRGKLRSTPVRARKLVKLKSKVQLLSLLVVADCLYLLDNKVLNFLLPDCCPFTLLITVQELLFPVPVLRVFSAYL
ncbi:hypothetical protein AVEN_164338-1 [Araneus ventricosus]|uniref:Uncharacterized protein n=1 Tax=Araneus ventricosus TaxID=182803 RepID=A0A4Y2L854_ARAVE|nr:hypothetical protein AVEN_164338-1 [Araneus ventricosus]